MISDFFQDAYSFPPKGCKFQLSLVITKYAMTI